MNEDRPISRKVFRRFLRRENEEVQKKMKLDSLRERITARYVEDEESLSEPDASDSSRQSISDSGSEYDAELSDHHSEDQEVAVIIEDNINNPIIPEEVMDDRSVDDNFGLDISSSDISSENSSDDEISGDEDENQHNIREFANEEEKSAYVREAIRKWTIAGGTASMRKVDALLKVLGVVHPNLPKSYKTLLQTPSNLEIREFPDGSSLWYKGIKTNLNTMELDQYLQKYGTITIDVNMDGLPLSKSSKLKFFPILGYLVNTLNRPFLIALYFGEWDPVDQHSYLHDYVTELIELFEYGYVRNGNSYPFKVRHYILDAPARSLIKCCVGHGGYGACEKCTDPGEMVADRMVYLNLNAQLRTDESYVNQEDQLHHVGRSRLEAVGTGMVSQFRLDPFHLVWHGVFKRLFKALNEWNGARKFTRQVKAEISRVLIFLSDFCPSDFCRPPRAFKEWNLYKGTEERRLCLYDGLLVFRGHMEANVYRNYLLLHAALYILASPVFVETMCDYANQLLHTFIEHSIAIYGRKFAVYNVHSLSHLASECSEHGPLDSFSAFKFEDFLKTLKNSLKSAYKPLQQAAFRDLERSANIEVLLESDEKAVSFRLKHTDPEEQLLGTHYKCIFVGSVKFQLGNKDSCFASDEGDIFVLRNIVKRGRSVSFVGNKFLVKSDFYDYPLPSSRLGIFKLSELDEIRHNIPLTSVNSKCYLMPDEDNFVCVPILHTFPLF